MFCNFFDDADDLWMMFVDIFWGSTFVFDLFCVFNVLP